MLRERHRFRKKLYTFTSSSTLNSKKKENNKIPNKNSKPQRRRKI
jgi:hypothetical protein